MLTIPGLGGPTGIPENLDKLSREQRRFLLAMAWMNNVFNMDDLVQVVKEGIVVWREFSRQQVFSHGLNQADQDWIFNEFKQRVDRYMAFTAKQERAIHAGVQRHRN